MQFLGKLHCDIVILDTSKSLGYLAGVHYPGRECWSSLILTI